MASAPARRSILIAACAALPLGFLAGCADTAPRPAAGDGASPPAAGDGATSTPALGTGAPSDAAGAALTVFASPTCGCCTLWVDQLTAQGFTVDVDHQASMEQVFARHGIRQSEQSCHLGRSATGALFVGHIPGRFITEYLADPPAGARGLSVPGMPAGSPGMETDGAFEPYEVLLLMQDGSARTFRQVNSAADQKA